ncbi:MAG: polynucleotide adenylyltransferase, partial [Oscillospiraceae bacterium]
MNIEIPSQVEKILKLLELSGYEAYIVGGCVRDSILGITPNDWDITTVAIPSQIIDVFKNYRTIKTGIKHGTVSVVMDKMCVEITTYRTETAYSDNRHPDVVNYVSCINDDLKRRDFTINSMAYNPQSGLLDIFNGFSDIQNKIIRCVGNPDERFKEDSLRILRCIRFSACYNFNIEKNTKKSIHDNAKLVTNISVERIISEFNKFIICDSVS